MSLTLKKNSAGTWVLTGVMNELVDYAALVNDPGHLVIDLRGIKSITSHGLRTWIDALRQIEGSSGRKVEFAGCPAIFLDAVDLVAGVMPSAGIKAIRSCCFEYFCDHCEKPSAKEFDRQKLGPAHREGLMNGVPCERCRLPMRAEDDLEVYCELFA